MTATRTHDHSPFEQIRMRQGVRLAEGAPALPLKDQAIVRRLLEEGCDFVDHPLFHEPDADNRFHDSKFELTKRDTRWYQLSADSPVARQGPETNNSRPLNPEEERRLFLKFNFARFKVNTRLADLRRQPMIGPEAARNMLWWHRKAKDVREHITEANIALVLAMAKRMRGSDLEFADLVSEGNMALLRAIDKFDVSRGFKFSTYACRAILKAFSRATGKFTRYRQMFPMDFDPALEKSDYQQRKHEQERSDRLDDLKQIINQNEAGLSELEQRILKYRFASSQFHGAPASEPLTLNQVGKLIGLTKERVRQIQYKALDKLRQAITSEVRKTIISNRYLHTRIQPDGPQH